MEAIGIVVGMFALVAFAQFLTKFPRRVDGPDRLYCVHLRLGRDGTHETTMGMISRWESCCLGCVWINWTMRGVPHAQHLVPCECAKPSSRYGGEFFALSDPDCLHLVLLGEQGRLNVERMHDEHVFMGGSRTRPI